MRSPSERPSEFATVIYEVVGKVVVLTLNRPQSMNAFNQRMLDEFREIWDRIRNDDEIRAVVLQAAGERAFCSGVDVREGITKESNIWSQDDPGVSLGPKHNQVWKPVIAAVHGMAAGGAFYWLNESDIIISSPEATFFDPHVTYGMTSALEPIGLARRIPLGEVLRWSLLGLDERMSAERAYQIGLVSEIVPKEELSAHALWIAEVIAAKPAAAIQGTVRAIWESLDMLRSQAQQLGVLYTNIGNPIGTAEIDRESVKRPEPRIR